MLPILFLLRHLFVNIPLVVHSLPAGDQNPPLLLDQEGGHAHGGII